MNENFVYVVIASTGVAGATKNGLDFAKCD